MANRLLISLGATAIVAALAACTSSVSGGLPYPGATATPALTAAPTAAPTASPTAGPTAPPTAAPTAPPTAAPTPLPTAAPTPPPTAAPTAPPTAAPTPTLAPTPTASPQPTPTATPVPTATPKPTASPSPAPSAPLKTATINGQATFVDSAQMPVYTHTGDSANSSTCTVASGCLAAWPVVPPPAGTLPANWTSFKRADNGQMQLEYKGQPLYTFVSDSPGVANGDGIAGFHLAHP